MGQKYNHIDLGGDPVYEIDGGLSPHVDGPNVEPLVLLPAGLTRQDAGSSRARQQAPPSQSYKLISLLDLLSAQMSGHLIGGSQNWATSTRLSSMGGGPALVAILPIISGHYGQGLRGSLTIIKAFRVARLGLGGGYSTTSIQGSGAKQFNRESI